MEADMPILISASKNAGIGVGLRRVAGKRVKMIIPTLYMNLFCE